MLRYSCKDSKEDVYNKIQITNKKSSLALLQKERKMKMKKEKSLYWALLVVALALVAGIGVTFAWFTNQAGRQGELVTTGTLQIQYALMLPPHWKEPLRFGQRVQQKYSLAHLN